jgi:hypothetical protein
MRRGDDPLLELGARARIIQIDEERQKLEAERSTLVRRFPSLVNVNSFDFANILADAEQFKRHAHNRAPRREYRTYDADFKEKVLDALRNGTYLADVSKKYDISSGVISIWAKKAGVQVPKMPKEELQRRLRGARREAPALPAPKMRDGAELGREILRAMPDDAPITLHELERITGVAKDNVRWRLERRRKDGHARKLKEPATWIKTAKGRQWQG